MKKLTVREILNVTNGSFYGQSSILDKQVANHAYMLNQLKRGGVYYIDQEDDETAILSINSAHKRGAVVCVTDREVANKVDGPVIKVKDLWTAIRSIGTYVRSFVKIPVIAVTGSVGKTSTKDMIVSVLSQKFKVTKTSPYWNSNYRIAFGLLNIEDKDEAIVIESAVGNMMDNIENGKVVEPDYVVMTNIGDSHMDRFKTQANIFEAKRRLLNYLRATGCAVLNFEDKFIKTVTLNKPQRIISVGKDKTFDCYATKIKDLALGGVSCTLNSKNESISVTIPVPGVHFVDAALIAFAIGKEFGLTLEEIKKGVESFETSDHRCKIVETNNVTILEDCYNTSPKSSKSALDILEKCNGRKVVIFGAMNRLGETSEYYHREIGQYIKSKNIDVVAAIGEDTKYLIDELKKISYAGSVHYFNEKHEIKDKLAGILKAKDCILIKGALPDNLAEITTWIEESKDIK